MFCSSAAMPAVKDFAVIDDTNVPTHKALQLRMAVSMYGKTVLKARLPRAFPVEASKRWSEEEEDDAALEAMLVVEAEWQKAHAKHDVNSLWQVWCQAAESYLVKRCQDAIPAESRHRHVGRGEDKQPVLQHVSAKQFPNTDGAQNLQQRRLQRLARKLEALSRQMRRLQEHGPGATPIEVQNLWANICSAGKLTLKSETWQCMWQKRAHPSLQEVTGLTARVQSEVQKESKMARSDRSKLWKGWLAEEVARGSQGKSRIVNRVVSQPKSSTAIMQTAAGDFVGSPAEIDALLHKAWDPILCYYTRDSEPCWEDFQKRFQTYMPRCHLEVGRLTGQRLKASLGKMRSEQAGGMEGWRVKELKKLPVVLLDRLAVLLEVVEQRGQWPSALERTLVTFIAKPEAERLRAEDLRPISVMSPVYRLWAATRLKEVLTWQESWAAPGQHGARPGHGTEDVFWELALKIENSVLSGTPLYGFSLDYCKCFDKLPQKILLQLAAEMGMDKCILKPLQGMYHNLRRRFRCGGSLGQEFQATSGILQGCPLSIILLNAMVSVWCRALSAEVPASSPGAYVDDTVALASRPGVLNAALKVTKEYEVLTGQLVHKTKSICFSTWTQSMKRLRFGSETLPQQQSIKTVGVTLHMQTGGTCEQTGARFQSARDIAKLMQTPQLPFEVRSFALSTYCNPKAMYGISVVDRSRQQLQALRRDVVKGLQGGHRGRHCAEILLTLCVQGHRCDPLQAAPYLRMRMLHRMLHKRHDLQGIFAECWPAASTRRGKAVGPIGFLRDAVERLGWTWVAPFKFKTTTATVDVLQVARQEWEHIVREGARRMVWKEAAERRADMQGIEAGINREATQALMYCGKLSAAEQGSLRTIQAGGLWTQDRWCRAGVTSTDRCSFCSSGAAETIEHVWWHCPAWRAIRDQYPKVMQSYKSDWPRCLLDCGIVPDNVTWEADVVSRTGLDVIDLTSDDAISDDAQPDWSQIGRSGRYGELMADGHVVVYTDGAARRNQSKYLRFAGYGAFWADGHPFNASAPLKGELQTNNRAELQAVAYVLGIEVRPVDIRTDSAYVQKGITKHMPHWNAEGWTRKGKPIQNADLWQTIAKLLETRPEGSLRVTKVKGHASREDVLAGSVAGIDRHGNDCADALAVAGAFANRGPSADSKRRHNTIVHAQRVQKMMLEIHAARAAETKRREPTEERSSSSCSSSSRSSSSSSSSTTHSARSSSGMPPD